MLFTLGKKVLRQTHVYTCHIDTSPQLKEKTRDICDDGGVSTISRSESAHGKFHSVLLHFCSTFKKVAHTFLRMDSGLKDKVSFCCLQLSYPVKCHQHRFKVLLPRLFFTHVYLNGRESAFVGTGLSPASASGVGGGVGKSLLFHL